MAIRALLNLCLKNSSKKHSKWYNVAEHLHDFAGESRRFLIHFQKRSKSKISIGSKNFVTKGLYFDRRLTSDASNSKNKLSDLRRLFGLARPEALRIAGNHSGYLEPSTCSTLRVTMGHNPIGHVVSYGL